MYELVMIDGLSWKPNEHFFILQNQILEQLHNNIMGIGKTRLLVRESVYWVNANTDIKILWVSAPHA